MDRNSSKDNSSRSLFFDWRVVVGSAVLVMGMLFFTAQATGIIRFAQVAPICGGLVLLAAAFHQRVSGYLIAGSVLSGTGLGLYWLWTHVGHQALPPVLGTSTALVAAGFAFITVGYYWLWRKWLLWPLIPAFALGLLAAVFLLTRMVVFDFILFLGVGLGIIFLVSGLKTRLLGLLIAGGVIVGVSAGISFAWGYMAKSHALLQTGAMLIWFGLGWALITVTARIAFHRMVWWPLIPGAILTVVGWGLYLSGNPGNAAAVLGNTGAMMMIVLGLYLILMRKGIKN